VLRNRLPEGGRLGRVIGHGGGARLFTTQEVSRLSQERTFGFKKKGPQKEKKVLKRFRQAVGGHEHVKSSQRTKQQNEWGEGVWRH